MAVTTESLIAAIDVGSSKVACLIARLSIANEIKVLGVGNRLCEGVVGGVVVDMEAVELAIRASVDQAEKMAGRTVSEVFLSFSGGEPKTHIIETEIEIKGECVTDADVTKVIEKAKALVDAGDEAILHTFPAALSVDGTFGVTAPKGMFGNELGIALLAVTVQKGPLKNLEACIRRAHLNVVDVVLSPYAAGLSVLDEDELKMGVACVDMGGGTTGISVFARGALVHSEVLPLGGDQITDEVARKFLTPLDQAERLKTFMGSAITDSADTRLEIEIAQVGETTGRENIVRMPRSDLTELVQKELELLFATVGEHLDASGFSGVAGRRVVLTGGVAQTEGVRDFASSVLGRRVRVGTPKIISGLPQAAQGPAFASTVGILLHAAALPSEERSLKEQAKFQEMQKKGLFGRMGLWIKENF
jgi:cell division protein FtsA